MGFVEGAATMFGAVRQTPNVELAGLRFDESGILTADVTGGSADIASLAARIGPSGLAVEVGTGSSGGGIIRVRRP